MTADEAASRTVQPDDTLWRRVPQWHWVEEPDGSLRPSSAAFEDDDDSPMSAVVASETTITWVLDPVREMEVAFAVAAVPVRTVTEAELVIVRAPEKDEPAHVHVLGNKTKGRRTRLAKASTWAWPPPGRPYPPWEPRPE